MASRIDRASITSPWRTSARLPRSRLALPGSRTTTLSFDPRSNNCRAISKPVPRVAPMMQNGAFILYCRNRTESWPRRRLRLLVCWHRNLFPNRCFPDPADEKPGQEDAESDYRCAEGHAYANEQEDAPKRKVCDPVKDLFHG